MKALILVVDALPGADTITEENRETIKPAFNAALTAYETLSGDDKAAFEATEQYAKLMALHTALYPIAPMAGGTVILDISDVANYVEITASGYKVGTAATESIYTGDYIITGSMTSSNSVRNHITVSGGTHNIIMRDVTINTSVTRFCAFEITGDSTINLTLKDTNTLKSGIGKAGLQVTEGNTLTITDASTGSLHAAGGNSSAGGNITVNGGTTSSSEVGTSLPLTVTSAMVVIAASKTEITYGESVTLTATIGKNGQTSPLAGTVQFADDIGGSNISLGSPVPIDSDGKATITIGKEVLTYSPVPYDLVAEFIPQSGSDYKGNKSSVEVQVNKTNQNGVVTIDGTPKYDETLTANTDDLSGVADDTLGEFTYRWISTTSLIGTGKTYTIQEHN